jgi:hypothetical protein
VGEPPFSWSVPVALVACALLPLRHVWPPLALLGGLWALAGGLGWPPALVALYALGRRSGRVSTTVPWLALPLVAAVTPVLVTQDLPWRAMVLTVAFVGLVRRCARRDGAAHEHPRPAQPTACTNCSRPARARPSPPRTRRGHRSGPGSGVRSTTPSATTPP